jgi:hypothetical protein
MADGAIADDVCEVVIDLPDDLIRQCVAEYRTLSSSRAYRIEHRARKRREIGDCNSHSGKPTPPPLLSEERAVVGWRVNEIHCPE